MKLRPGSNAPTTSGGALSALTRSVLARKRLVALLWATVALAGLVAAGRASGRARHRLRHFLDPDWSCPMLNLTRWMTRHRWLVVCSWIVIAVGVLVASQAVGRRDANNFSLPNTDSKRAVDLMRGSFPAQAGDADQIVFRARTGTLEQASARAAIVPMLQRVAKLPHVAAVQSPYAAGANAISKDRTVAFATVLFDQRANELPTSAVDHVIDTAEAARVIDPAGRPGRPGDQAGSESWARLRDRGRDRRRRRRPPGQLRILPRDGAADRDGAARARRRARPDRSPQSARRHGRFLR
jgi:hypothetical protein